jgi:phenylalanyl-tRNA synthetase beta chain
MKISLDWLSEYVEIDTSAEEIAEVLSNLGFPNEGIEVVESDTVIDVEVTSNRGDCLSHIGIARELAGATGKKLTLPEIKLPESDKDVGDFVDVRIENGQLCGRYTARVITGIKVGPTPEWMKKRLEAVGIRSVNNVVDASNYAMMECGQPPHAFDNDKLTGGEIIIRPGVKGERLVSIDETKCELDEKMLVIADKSGPVAIAGVMGGLATEISDSTTAVLLEDAHFDPVSIRTTGRRLGIGSEASFRFERHVDIEMIDWASQRCAQLITDVAGGVVVKGVVDAYPAKWEQQTVGMRFSRLNKLLGIEVKRGRVLEIFEALAFEPQLKKDDLVVCSVPSWRHDIYREADLIEEIARCHGYDEIPVERKINIAVAAVDKREKMGLKLRNFLNGCGFYETINVTFVDDSAGEAFIEDGGQGHLSVRDVSRKSANKLRRTLLGSLVSVLKTNYNAGNVPCRIFELANTFEPVEGGEGSSLPVERTKLALVFDGDFRELRGVVEGVAAVFNKDLKVDFKSADIQWAEVGAEVSIDGQVLGRAGIISQETVGKFGLEEVKPCAAELDFDTLLNLEGGSFVLKSIPRFPSITRDLSLVVNESTKWADIINAVNSKAPTELEDVKFTGIYRGKPIPSGKKSVTVSLCFRDEDGTLRHEVVDGFENEILSELTETLGAELRTV